MWFLRIKPTLMRFALVAAPLLWPGILLFAQSEPVFEAQAERTELSVGNTVTVTFTLRNGNGKNLQVPAPAPQLRKVGRQEFSSGGGFINGRPYYRESWSYTYVAVAPGAVSLGPASITVNGRTLRTTPIVFNIKAAKAGSGDKIFLRAELYPDSAYPGQQARLQVRLYTAVDVEGLDLIALPQVTGGRAEEKRRYDTRVEEINLKGKTYAVRTIFEAGVFPSDGDSLKIGEARVRAGLLPPDRRDPYAALDMQVLQSQTIETCIRKLPQPAPALFSGLVGRYGVIFEKFRDTIRQNEAFTLNAYFEGNGDPQRFGIPQISLGIPELLVQTPTLKNEETYENTAELMHSRVLDYPVSAATTGNFVFVPQVCVFDVDSNRYVFLRGDTMRITILPPATEDVFFSSSNSAGWWKSPWFWSILLALVLGALTFYLLGKRRSTVISPEPLVLTPAPEQVAMPDTNVEKSNLLPETAFEQARLLRNNPDARAFYDALYKALQQYLSDRLHLSPAEMTWPLIRQKLEQSRAPELTLSHLEQVWQRCEQALFAGQVLPENMEATWRQTQTFYSELERHFRTRS